MKRVILDENLPVRLRYYLVEFKVVTVQYQGWAGILNGELMQLIEGNFDVFVTGDKNLRYQQDLRGRTIAIIEVSSTDRRSILELLDKLKAAISGSTVGGYIQI